LKLLVLFGLFWLVRCCSLQLLCDHPLDGAAHGALSAPHDAAFARVSPRSLHGKIDAGVWGGGWQVGGDTLTLEKP